MTRFGPPDHLLHLRLYYGVFRHDVGGCRGIIFPFQFADAADAHHLFCMPREENEEAADR